MQTRYVGLIGVQWAAGSVQPFPGRFAVVLCFGVHNYCNTAGGWSVEYTQMSHLTRRLADKIHHKYSHQCVSTRLTGKIAQRNDPINSCTFAYACVIMVCTKRTGVVSMSS